jgi:hypothetical protein
MPNLSAWVTKDELSLIRTYLTAKRNELAASQAAAPAPAPASAAPEPAAPTAAAPTSGGR